MRWGTAVILSLALIFVPDLIAGSLQWENLLMRTAVICLTWLITYGVESTRYRKPALLIFIIIGGISLIAYLMFEFSQIAWFLVVLWFAAMILLQRQLSCTLFRHKIWQILWLLCVWGSTALIAGVGLAVFDAVLSRFAEEEFFVAVSGLSLTFFWLILAVIYHLTSAAPTPFFNKGTQPKWVVVVSILSLLAITLLIFPWLLNQYQRSFFPLTAPSYAGLSEANPFLCELVAASPQTIPSDQIKQDHIQLLENQLNKNTLTWGNLALYNQDLNAATEFRSKLLQEASQNLFTTPAHSVKWGQYEAALRIHQFVILDQLFPDLFSEEDTQILMQWFADINKRSLTIEWVDWLYAAAYGIWPQGPYENQEIGAGLLAALNHYGFADEFAAQNESYLETVPLGWQELFRNTDDSYSYQSVWLANAWWINQYRQAKGGYDATTQQNIGKSLEWLLLLSLPDGETFSYNIHGEPSLAQTYLLAAALSDDPALSWLAGHTMRRLLENDGSVPGYIAIDPLPLVDGQRPTVGSCLLFGNSGVPTEKGPLAPDKVVFREGWQDDDAYAVLNLRFTGWHKYKATNTIPLIYQDGPIVTERWAAENFWWLPYGRSAFRDKRVPREFLNGLLIPKSGLSEVLWRLTAVGTSWAQDPPAYAEVDTFGTSDIVDISVTTVPNWHGWQHTRTMYQIQDGLILVMDNANSEQASQPVSLIWHLDGRGEVTENKMQLDNEQRAASVVWPQDDTPSLSQQALPSNNTYLRSPNWELLYTSESEDTLTTSFAFLTQDYTQGDFDLTYLGENREGALANWVSGDSETQLLHNFSNGYLETDSLATDGRMLLRVKDGSERKYCYAGGETIHIKPDGTETITAVTWEDTILDSALWQQQNGWLTISLPTESPFGCFEINT